jgi:peptide-methionine (R)-S-oxide reductase
MVTQKSDKEWREQLTDDQYRVLRQKGTEVPFSGQYVYSKDKGMYSCAACGNKLFSSQEKYDSTTPGLIGWPSFSEALNNDAVTLQPDNSLGMQRTEVICGNCSSHLGHLFEDETSPNGKHYCINSICLDFEPDKKKE